MVEVVPNINATEVVIVVKIILGPTASMVFSMRSTGSPWWPVLKYSPVMINVSSRPMPKKTNTRRLVIIVIGTPVGWKHKGKIKQ